MYTYNELKILKINIHCNTIFYRVGKGKILLIFYVKFKKNNVLQNYNTYYNL